jgi:hypothetical protein
MASTKAADVTPQFGTMEFMLMAEEIPADLKIT